MSEFNYKKAYCVSVVPTWRALSNNVLDVHSKVRVLIGESKQGKNLAIPLTPAVKELLESLTTQDLAELSRVSYFAGHYHVPHLPTLFDNKRGEAWKVSNCIDQILRKRLTPPHNIQIHNGQLRVTFSNENCWIWEEFGLATEKNLETFKTCGLPFGEETLEESAKELETICGDLWPDPDSLPGNEMYQVLKEREKQAEKVAIKERFERRIKDLKKEKLNAQFEIEFLLLCNENNISIENVIYYSHTNTFSFGWRRKLSENEINNIIDKMGDKFFGYNIEFKKVS